MNSKIAFGHISLPSLSLDMSWMSVLLARGAGMVVCWRGWQGLQQVWTNLLWQLGGLGWVGGLAIAALMLEGLNLATDAQVCRREKSEFSHAH